MTSQNAQSQTLEMGGTEVGSTPSAENDANGVAATQGESGAFGVVDSGLSRNGSPFDSRPITGGIIAQLIADAEDRLGEMEECVVWYRKEVAKAQKRIAELKELQQQLEADSQSED
jgi:hypothetical protein